MTRLAYIWVFCTLIFAIWFHSHEESNRRDAIAAATEEGLRVGVRAGCQENNHLRVQIWRTASVLHPEQTRETVRENLHRQNCRDQADKVVRVYLRRAEKR